MRSSKLALPLTGPPVQRPSLSLVRVLGEWSLVRRCLDHDEAAWTTLDGRHEAALKKYVERRCPGPLGRILAEEVAGDVLSSLFHRDYARLRRFDPLRGCLRSYLLRLARKWLDKRLRSRLGEVDSLPSQLPMDPRTGIYPLVTWLEELLPRLTPQERLLCLAYLKRTTQDELNELFTHGNHRQLRRRLRLKVLLFLEGEPNG